jgi:monoamine oxidase
MLRAYGVDPTSLLWDALAVELGNNQVLDIDVQSYLGLTAVVRGGQLGNDIDAFWTQSEIFRCEAGNQELARRLRDLLDAATPGAVHTSTPVDTLTITADRVRVTAGAADFQSDFAVLAVPQPTWPEIDISPPVPQTYLISTGPAVKYLSPVAERFWLPGGQAPAGMSDALGMTWEGTDNQMVVGDQGVELSVFAGGRWAEAALRAPDKREHFTHGLDQMLPGYRRQASGPGRFIDWPNERWTRCGYSCATVGQVTTAGPLLASMYEERLAFAGEHTNMAMFGYMEGALQSGFLAAVRIQEAAGVAPAPPGA